MTRRPRIRLVGLAIVALLGGSAIALLRSPLLQGIQIGLLPPIPVRLLPPGDDTETVEVTDYTTPKDDDIPLADDRLGDKKTAFDPALVDRRPIEEWSLNASEAVLRLD